MLRRAQAFIELNLGKRFSLSELATWVGVSRFHFARLFRASAGHSPMQYVVSKRVELGKMLLVRDEYSISRVATLLRVLFAAWRVARPVNWFSARGPAATRV